MARRAFVDGQWVDAPDAPQLPPAARPPAAQPPAAAPAPAAPPAGAGSLERAGAVLGNLAASYGTTPVIASDAPVSVDQSGMGIGGSPLAVGTSKGNGQWRRPEDLETARRRAFLDSKDSMSGIRAVRNLLSEEVTNRGGDATAGGSIPSIRGLEGQLAKLGPAKGIQSDSNGNWIVSNDSAGEEATRQAMSFGNPAAAAGNRIAGGPDAVAPQAFDSAMPQLAPSGNLPQAGMNAYMQGAMKQKLQANQQPLNEIASWQVTQKPITALREDPGRDAKLAAYAARGEQAPTTPGEAVLAAGAGNAYGTRAGQFKPGNTLNLGFLDPDQLPPLNSKGHYTAYNPGNYF